MSNLLHPEYFKQIPFVGETISKRLNSRDIYVSSQPHKSGGLTIGIRTLNEAAALEVLLGDIRKQVFNGEIEIVVVDNESTDTTVDVARKFGATVISLPRKDFTYPRSMNLAMEHASNDHVFLTVGHAQLVSRHSLQAGYDHFLDTKLSGAYGHALPSSNATWIENLIGMGNLYYTKPQEATMTGLGVMAATGAMLDRSVWEKLGKFDESFEQGGEDGDMAQKMLSAGYRIFHEPLLSTHHTHGLGLVNTYKQWRGWTKLGRPSKLDVKKLAKRRPDLKVKSS